MFEGLRKSSQSLMLVILIASLATMFGVSFGPGRGGCNAQSMRVNYIARVYGNTISELDFQAGARMTGLSQRTDQGTWRRAISDGLIERELLAHEAERLGFRITDDQLNHEIQDGYSYMSLGSRELSELASPLTGPASLSARTPVVYSRDERRPGEAAPAFNYDDFDNWTRSVFGRTVPDYKQAMTREMLAESVRNIVMQSVRVSEDEVWRDYARQHNQVTLRYVGFSPEFYRLTVRDDDAAAVDAWAAAHATEINDLWTARHESLQHLPAQMRIRQLFLRFPDDAQDPAKIATEQRAQALRAQIVAPGGDFVRTARLYSQDESSWRAGGETEWRTVDRIDLPDDVKRVLPSLQPGQVSAPIRAPSGVFLVQVLARREGDVSEADGKHDIARELYLQARGNEAAHAAATRMQTLLGAAGASMDTVAEQIQTEALTAFRRGDLPASITLPGNNVLEPVSGREPGAPSLRETQSFTRDGTVPGIENSAPLVAAAFALTEAHPSAAAPVAVGDDQYVIRLKDHGRQEASRDDFTHDRQRLMDSYALPRRREALLAYLARLRADADRTGDVRIGTSPLLTQGPTRGTAPAN